MIQLIKKVKELRNLEKQKDWKGGFIPLEPITQQDLELLLCIREQGVIQKWK